MIIDYTFYSVKEIIIFLTNFDVIWLTKHNHYERFFAVILFIKDTIATIYFVYWIKN